MPEGDGNAGDLFAGAGVVEEGLQLCIEGCAGGCHGLGYSFR